MKEKKMVLNNEKIFFYYFQYTILYFCICPDNNNLLHT